MGKPKRLITAPPTRIWDFFKRWVPQNLALPSPLVYRLVVGMAVRRFLLLTGPLSKEQNDELLDTTSVGFIEGDPKFLIQKTTWYTLAVQHHWRWFQIWHKGTPTIKYKSLLLTFSSPTPKCVELKRGYLHWRLLEKLDGPLQGRVKQYCWSGRVLNQPKDVQHGE